MIYYGLKVALGGTIGNALSECVFSVKPLNRNFYPKFVVEPNVLRQAAKSVGYLLNLDEGASEGVLRFILTRPPDT